jgi:hypothetical protein
MATIFSLSHDLYACIIEFLGPNDVCALLASNKEINKTIQPIIHKFIVHREEKVDVRRFKFTLFRGKIHGRYFAENPTTNGKTFINCFYKNGYQEGSSITKSGNRIETNTYVCGKLHGPHIECVKYNEELSPPIVEGEYKDGKILNTKWKFYIIPDVRSLQTRILIKICEYIPAVTSTKTKAQYYNGFSFAFIENVLTALNGKGTVTYNSSVPGLLVQFLNEKGHDTKPLHIETPGYATLATFAGSVASNSTITSIVILSSLDMIQHPPYGCKLAKVYTVKNICNGAKRHCACYIPNDRDLELPGKLYEEIECATLTF